MLFLIKVFAFYNNCFYGHSKLLLLFLNKVIIGDKLWTMKLKGKIHPMKKKLGINNSCGNSKRLNNIVKKISLKNFF